MRPFKELLHRNLEVRKSDRGEVKGKPPEEDRGKAQKREAPEVRASLSIVLIKSQRTKRAYYLVFDG